MRDNGLLIRMLLIGELLSRVAVLKLCFLESEWLVRDDFGVTF